MGQKLIAGCPDGEDASITSLEQLKDVVLKEVKDDSFLVYDKEISAWTNKELKDLVYVGATEKSGGIPGLVPAASANAKDLFLRADGTWSSPGATSQLKRKIVESVDEIDLKSAQATQFIYMVPTGTVTDHNVYKEYIVLDIEKNGVINRVLE